MLISHFLLIALFCSLCRYLLLQYMGSAAGRNSRIASVAAENEKHYFVGAIYRLLTSKVLLQGILLV